MFMVSMTISLALPLNTKYLYTMTDPAAVITFVMRLPMIDGY